MRLTRRKPVRTIAKWEDGRFLQEETDKRLASHPSNAMEAAGHQLLEKLEAQRHSDSLTTGIMRSSSTACTLGTLIAAHATEFANSSADFLVRPIAKGPEYNKLMLVILRDDSQPSAIATVLLRQARVRARPQRGALL